MLLHMLMPSFAVFITAHSHSLLNWQDTVTKKPLPSTPSAPFLHHATADTYMNDDSFVQKTLLFSRHDEVVCVVFVVHNVLQVNA